MHSFLVLLVFLILFVSEVRIFLLVKITGIKYLPLKSNKHNLRKKK